MEIGDCTPYSKVGQFKSVDFNCNDPILAGPAAPSCAEQCDNLSTLKTSVVNIDNYDVSDVPGGKYLPICAGENGTTSTSTEGISGIPCDKSSTAYVIRNPGWQPGVNEDGINSYLDVALIILPEEEAITDIEPVTLNTDSNRPKAGDELVAIGRGVTNPLPNNGQPDESSSSPIPLTVSLGYVDNQNELCTSAAETIADNQLCAYTENKGVCYGDSGKNL